MLIRLILAVPHFICLGIAGLATQIVIVGGWLVALVMGRRSGPAAEYLVGYHQWKTRLHAYLLLLTDKYPPVGWRNDLYPVGELPRGRDVDGHGDCLPWNRRAICDITSNEYDNCRDGGVNPCRHGG